MRNKREISRDVVVNDNFISLSKEARILYFYLNLEADDRGFVHNAKTIIRIHELESVALDELINNGYLIGFENVVLIRHWLINNTIKLDRFKETIHTTEFELVSVDRNKRYNRKDTENVTVSVVN